MSSEQENYFLINFGKKITKIREMQQLSKVQLAFELDIGEKHVRRIEKGELNIGILLLKKLSEVLNVRVDELMDLENNNGS